MKKEYYSIFACLFVSIILGLIYFTMMPQWTSDDEGLPTEFSTKRALNQVETISKKPHYVDQKIMK